MVEGPPSKQTLMDWQEFFRDVMSKCVLQETTRKLGGPGKIVVVDETALGHRKYHHGLPVARETCCGIGIYDVENEVVVLEFLSNCSRAEMVPRIVSNVAMRSEVHTDEHRSYVSLPAAGYIHKTINHSQTFRAPDDAHANHIEAYFSRVKSFLRKKNVKAVYFIPSYL